MAFKVEDQREDMWCWVAVAASVDHYFDPTSTWSQCRIAGAVLGKTTCCSDPDSCNQAGSLEDALRVVDNLKSVEDGPLAFDDVVKQLRLGRPVCVRIGWNEDGGHFVAIRGCDPDARLVDVEDPLFPDWTIPYDELVSDYQGGGNVPAGGTWTLTMLVRP